MGFGFCKKKKKSILLHESRNITFLARIKRIDVSFQKPLLPLRKKKTTFKHCCMKKKKHLSSKKN